MQNDSTSTGTDASEYAPGQVKKDNSNSPDSSGSAGSRSGSSSKTNP
jgi:hypothetical protein